MERVPFLVNSLKTTRQYTTKVLDWIPESDWFKQPEGGVTHTAWQVGHLAIAEYFLAMERIRGEQPGDNDLINDDFRKRFGRTSIPDPNPDNNPSPSEIRAWFDRVHEQALQETANLNDSVLDERCDGEHPMFKDKFGSLNWCVQHEFSHAGQLSLIRRLLGSEFAW